MAERHNLNQMSQSPPMLGQLRCPENSDDGHTLDVGVAGTVDRLRTAWTKYVAYRKALAELRDLPTRALRDLAFNRGDLATLAHREVYGH